MFDKIVFYCGAGFGDNFLARTFVKYIVDNIPAGEYIWYYRFADYSPYDKNYIKIYQDIEKLSPKRFEGDLPFNELDAWKVIDNILYVNTWCVCNHHKYLHRFGGVGLPPVYYIFKEGLKTYCNHDISTNMSEFIPDIDFSKFKISNINLFMEKNQQFKKILIVNGIASAGQAENFDFNPIIEELSLRNADYLFFMSNYPKGLSKPNIFYCKDIIGIDENDIVESAYFANFCSTIIGRASGVYTYCLNKENLISNPKKFLCYSKSYNYASLGMENIIDIKDRIFNLPITDNISMIDFINKNK